MSSPRYWRTRAQRYTLVGAACPQCGSKHFPPRDVCPDCRRPALETLPVPSPGQSYYFNVMHLAVAGHEVQSSLLARAR
jgi:uncharacterized OB-fold protein